jgi:hypothetical protein
MPDSVVRIYLYFLLGTTILFVLLWVIVWLVRPTYRGSVLRTKNLIRDLLFLISGLVGFCIFSNRLLNNWIIMALMCVLVIGSVYLTEGLVKLLGKRAPDNGAT